jgi:hypothetical protein
MPQDQADVQLRFGIWHDDLLTRLQRRAQGQKESEEENSNTNQGPPTSRSYTMPAKAPSPVCITRGLHRCKLIII